MVSPTGTIRVRESCPPLSRVWSDAPAADTFSRLWINSLGTATLTSLKRATPLPYGRDALAGRLQWNLSRPPDAPAIQRSISQAYQGWQGQFAKRPALRQPLWTSGVVSRARRLVMIVRICPNLSRGAMLPLDVMAILPSAQGILPGVARACPGRDSGTPVCFDRDDTAIS